MACLSHARRDRDLDRRILAAPWRRRTDGATPGAALEGGHLPGQAVFHGKKRHVAVCTGGGGPRTVLYWLNTANFCDAMASLWITEDSTRMSSASLAAAADGAIVARRRSADPYFATQTPAGRAGADCILSVKAVAAWTSEVGYFVTPLTCSHCCLHPGGCALQRASVLLVAGCQPAALAALPPRSLTAN